jgi:prevent-host-death family protein
LLLSTLHDAQQHLQQLLDDAQHGKTIIIVDGNNRAVRLVPVMSSSRPRQAGSARGQIRMAPDFDEPLTDFDEYMK